MDYKKMSNEEIQKILIQRFPRPHFKDVTEFNRKTVIALLEVSEDLEGRISNVQSKDK